MRQLDGNFSFGQPPQKSFKILRQLVVGRVSDELVEIAGDRPYIFGDTPLVIVQNANKPFRSLGHVVERLKRNAIGERGIAKNGDYVFVASSLVARSAHS